jgi:erythromycin esterase-like protein
MKHLLIIILFLLQLNVVKSQEFDTTIFVNWLNEKLIRVNNLDVNKSPELDEIFKSKRIVGIGEPVHGSKTVNEIRNTLAKHLIQNNGFSAIAFEFPFKTGLEVNDYVLNGKGNINDIISNSNFFIKSYEFIDLIEWIKNRNENRINKVQVFGFDIQGNRDLTDDLTNYFILKNKSLSNDFDKIKQIISTKGNKYKNFTKDEIEFTRNTLNKAKLEFIECSSADCDLGKQKLFVFENHLKMANSSFSDGVLMRDSCNALIIKWVTDKLGEDSKLILSAHSGHLGKFHILSPRVRTMQPDIFYHLWEQDFFTGYWLNKIFEDDYYFIGIQFNKGFFMGFNPNNKFKMDKMEVTPPSSNSLNFLLSKANSNNYLIELKPSMSSHKMIIDYLCSFQNCYSIGAAYDYKYLKTMLVEYYDAILFIDSVQESNLIKYENEE